MSLQPGLLLVDLQNDYLDQLSSVSGTKQQQLIQNVSALLDAFRALSLPVIHSQTQTLPDGSNRMPHWKRNNQFLCVLGTPGVYPPAALQPGQHESVLSKPYYSAFGNPALIELLNAQQIKTLAIAGVHTHACIRETIVDAYQHGFDVILVNDCVASYDDEHEQHSLHWLGERCAKIMESAQLMAQLQSNYEEPREEPREEPGEETGEATDLEAGTTWQHFNPCHHEQLLSKVSVATNSEVDAVCNQARDQFDARKTNKNIQEKLSRWLELLEQHRDNLLDLLTTHIAKPIKAANAEIEFALALLRYTLNQSGDQAGKQPGDQASYQSGDQQANYAVAHHPRGVIALITPWNNPVSIPVGKLAPAIAYGNQVIWKPAPQADAISQFLHNTLVEAGLVDQVAMLSGDASTGQALANNMALDAISFTGSIKAGQEIGQACVANGCEYQAELGGNNALIITADVDMTSAAEIIAAEIFSFSGQRCTAISRLIVESAIVEVFTAALIEQTKKLTIGLPSSPETDVGPVISHQKQQALLQLIHEAEQYGAEVLYGGKAVADFPDGCWLEPTIIMEKDPDSVYLGEENFGPIVVIQPAEDFAQAMTLCNNSDYGLLAGLFSNDLAKQALFKAQAKAGMLLINQARPRFDASAPFTGWQQSAIGLPEHGQWDRLFYTKPQTIYS